MEDDDFGDWDEEFLEAAIRAEEYHLSSQLPPQQQKPPSDVIASFLPQVPPPTPPHRKVSRSVAGSLEDPGSFSPPRELSQRPPIGNDNDSLRSPWACGVPTCGPLSSSFSRTTGEKDLEIERLKRELGRVTKQLTELEREALELRKTKDRENSTEPGCSKNQRQDANVHFKERANSESRFHAAPNDKLLKEVPSANISDDQKSMQMQAAKSACKDTGVQAELFCQIDLSKKLLDVWSSRYQNFGKNVVQKLMTVCSSDFYHLNISTSSQAQDSITPRTSSRIDSQYDDGSPRGSEHEKIYQLYSVLSKISSGMIDVKALFEPLVKLCSVEKVSMVHSSLRILHALLKILTDMDVKSECTLLRNNIMVEEPVSGSRSRHVPRSENCGHTFLSRKRDHSILGEVRSGCNVNWEILFALMHQIAMRTTHEHVRLEAVSIMNLIVMRSGANKEREKFGSTMAFEGIPVLLRKDAGIRVQEEAVHLLYLLLNCTKVLAAFSSCSKGKESLDSVNGEEESALTYKNFTMILDSLAECITSRKGNAEHLRFLHGINLTSEVLASQDLRLWRRIIIVLAFLASSGTSGFGVLVNHQLPRGANFLMLLLQLLVSVIDAEAEVAVETAEVFKARTLLMREALILLNRLVASPSSAITILRALTKTRDMANLSSDVSNRLSRKAHIVHQSDTVTRQIRENEIPDLARGFKRRISCFLGDDILP